MTSETIRTARDGDVLTITLNRPERLNAAPPAMLDAIGAALDDLGGARATTMADKRVDPPSSKASPVWRRACLQLRTRMRGS